MQVSAPWPDYVKLGEVIWGQMGLKFKDLLEHCESTILTVKRAISDFFYQKKSFEFWHLFYFLFSTNFLFSNSAGRKVTLIFRDERKYVFSLILGTFFDVDRKNVQKSTVQIFGDRRRIDDLGRKFIDPPWQIYNFAKLN